MRFDEFATRAGEAVRDAARRVHRPEFGQLRSARRRRTALAVGSSALVGTLLIFVVVLIWPPGSGAPVQPAAPISTANTITSSTLAEEGSSPAACGDSLPLLATFTPSGADELDPEGTPGPGPNSIPVEENQLVAHWFGEGDVVVEMRWPATTYLDEPPATPYGDEPFTFDSDGLPAQIGLWSSAADNRRVVAQIQLADGGDDPCSLLSVDGFGPQIERVYDMVLGFAESLRDEEGYNRYLDEIDEQEQRRSQEIFCDQPPAEAGDGEMVVTVYEICDQGQGTGTRVLSGLQPVDRVVEASNTPLRAAVEALVEGPTPEEAAAGFGGWFSPATADAVLSVSLNSDGAAAVVDLDADLIEGLNNVSTSTGGAYFRGQLYGTVFATGTVDTVEFRLDGDRERFCSLFESDCTPITYTEWDQIYADEGKE